MLILNQSSISKQFDPDIFMSIFKSAAINDKIGKILRQNDEESVSNKCLLKIITIPQVHSIINLALTFDVIYTMGYWIEEKYSQIFNKFAKGDYKFVIKSSFIYIKQLQKAIQFQNQIILNNSLWTIKASSSEMDQINNNSTLIWANLIKAINKQSNKYLKIEINNNAKNLAWTFKDKTKDWEITLISPFSYFEMQNNRNLQLI